MTFSLHLPKLEFGPIRRFFYTYKQILSIAYKVSPFFLILVTITNALWGFTNLPILYINKILIDTVINNLGKSDIDAPLKIIAALIIFRGLIEFSRSALSGLNRQLSNLLIERIDAHLQAISGEKLNVLDISTVEDPEFQDKYKKIDRESKNRLWGMIGPLADIPNAIFTIISGLIPIFSFNPLLSLLVFAAGVPDIFISSKIAKRDYLAAEILGPKWRLWGWLEWHLSDSKNFYENRILGSTAYLVKRLLKVQEEVHVHNYIRRINRWRLGLVGSIPGNILSVGINIYFFALALGGKITLGFAQLLYSASTTLNTGFGSLTSDGVNIYENYLFIKDLTWFLNLESDLTGDSKLPPLVVEEGIEFNDVWFKYPRSKRWILKGVSFSIGPTQNLALVGENGAGKTTLIKLLCGFYKPTRGQILIDGEDISTFDREKYWKLLAVLFQDFSHYPFSARESIGLGRISKMEDLARIKASAKLTGIDGFIEKLPLGYNNPLVKEFDKGVDPSRGQWQRIALARILFRGSKVIILDEPTSNVDPKAEQEIFEKIMELAKDKILILISHRFSTVRKADVILNLDKGKIIEQGTHEELMQRGGEYADLFNLQAKGYQ